MFHPKAFFCCCCCFFNFKHPSHSLRTLPFAEKNFKKPNTSFPHFHTKQLDCLHCLYLRSCVYLHRVNAAHVRNDREEMISSSKHRRKAFSSLRSYLEFPLVLPYENIFPLPLISKFGGFYISS